MRVPEKNVPSLRDSILILEAYPNYSAAPRLRPFTPLLHRLGEAQSAFNRDGPVPLIADALYWIHRRSGRDFKSIIQKGFDA